MTSCRMKPSEMSKSSAMTGRAGVTIVDEKGLMKVNMDTSIVTTHFRGCDQLRGFAGSFGPSQVIWSTRQRDVCGSVETNTYNDILF